MARVKARPGAKRKRRPLNSPGGTASEGVGLVNGKPLTPRQERFCQLVASELLTYTEAYEKAGYPPDDSHASRLAGNGRIRARICQIQRSAIKVDPQALKAEVIQHLVNVINADPQNLPPGSAVVQEWAETRTGRRIPKLVSKSDSARLLASLLGWEQGTQAEQDAAKALGGVAELVQRIRARK